jgi:hypothetical protein
MEEKTRIIFEKAKSTAVVIGQKTVEVAGRVGDKAMEMIDNTKISVAIRELEREINEIYQQIGKEIYSAQKNDAGAVDVDDKFMAVDLKLEQLEELSSRIKSEVKERRCPNPECGNLCSLEDNFCSKCGAVIE